MYAMALLKISDFLREDEDDAFTPELSPEPAGPELGPPAQAFSSATNLAFMLVR